VRTCSPRYCQQETGGCLLTPLAASRCFEPSDLSAVGPVQADSRHRLCLAHRRRAYACAGERLSVLREDAGAAVGSVYCKYLDRVERQYANLELSVDVPLAEHKPESRLRFIDAGLQFTVRYPVEIQHALKMGERILRAVHEAVDGVPK